MTCQSIEGLSPILIFMSGVNWNRGQKICLRLRYPGDANQFLPLEQVVDTMLHELSHIVHGPHDEHFHALWNKLRDEHEDLIRKGYTGEGFLSEGKRLGGRRVPKEEARRIARVAAEKRRTLASGSGQRLGGAPLRVGQDIRSVIVDAIEKRATITKGCANGEGGKSAAEIKIIVDDATHNGFATKAEEDSANEAAIAQALWELVQEDEKRKYGNDYVSPSQENPAGSSEIKQEKKWQSRSITDTPAYKPAEKPTAQSRGAAPNLKREAPLSPPVDRSHASKSATNPASTIRASKREVPTSQSGTKDPPAKASWTCPICTCNNPIQFLCCDACTIERPAGVTQEFKDRQFARTNPITSQISRAATPVAAWTCRCSNVMEAKWWTCNVCGRLKETS